MTDIAIFPIPNCVTFPKAIFPLHVFEPRYRGMIHHCLDNDLLLGIAHTQKVISEAKASASLDTNLATYKPFTVFSAGQCELIDTLEDGRLYCEVLMQARYRMVSEQQKLPFMIYHCELYTDDDSAEPNASELELLKEKITQRLLAITSDQEDVQTLLTSKEWAAKTAKELSFELFNIIRFAPETQQDILEMTSAHTRLDALLTLLA